jgi:predicted dehydrogenase
MADSIRLGVIGLGNIGKQHVAQIGSGGIERCSITALASRQPSELAQEIGARHFTDYRKLVDSGLCDAVLVATPTHSHREVGAYVLQAGLHLLMEKPLGLSVAEGEQLLSCRQQEQVFALMLNQRTDPTFLKMKTVIDAGHLGELRRVQWTMTNWFRPEVYFQVSDWRATWRGEGGGLLVNQCIHNLDILQWLVGMPNRVTGFCGFGKYHEIEVEDEATAYLEYDNGVTGVFIGSTGESPGVNQLDIVGDGGMLSFDGDHLVLQENSPATSQFNRESLDMFGQPETSRDNIISWDSVNQHAILLENFVAAILDGAELIAPAATGLNSLALANGILWSAWTGESIALPLDSAGYQQALQQKIAGSQLRTPADIEVKVDMGESYR